MNKKTSALLKNTSALLAIVAAGSLAMSARAQNDVYAVEFNQANNLFGTIDLLTGDFTQIASLGSTLYNDIAYCPIDGTLYGIQNNGAELVTFDKTTGTVSAVAPLNVPGLESIAFRPSDGVLFGAAQSGLYTIDRVTGQATFVGSFGTPYNLNLAQNIRFDYDGNLYLSNTGENTDIYRVNTQDGSATFVGEVAGFADLILENGSQYMYGVSIPSINGATPQPELLAFDLSSFVNGGTNSDGSIHEITVTNVGSGPYFPVDFNFSGNVPVPPPVYVPKAPTLTIAPQPDGSVQVTASGGIPNQIYILQASSGNGIWTAISTNSADANGVFPFIDSDATNHAMRFYRAATPQ